MERNTNVVENKHYSSLLENLGKQIVTVAFNTFMHAEQNCSWRFQKSEVQWQLFLQ